MDILPYSGGSHDGGDQDAEFRRGTVDIPASTPTSVSPSVGPGNSLEIKFDDPIVTDPDLSQRVLSSRGPKDMKWSITRQATIQWIAWVSKSKLDSTPYTIDNMTLPPEMEAINGNKGWLTNEDLNQITLEVPKWLNSLKGSPTDSHARPTDFMTLQVAWTRTSDKVKGISNSGVFFLQSPTSSQLESPTPSPSDITGYDTPDTGSPASTASTIPNPTGETTTPNANPGGTSNPPGNTSTSASSSGSTALSPGAIAGIAVGGAVAIILIVALTWFCNRRRRTKHHQPTYDSSYKTNTIMEDKVLATAQVANSRPSGYSEDSTRREYPSHNTNTNNTTSAAYDDEIDHRPHPLITQPIPKKVSHYVEDHHTNDDLERIIREEAIIQHDINAAANPTHAPAERH